MLSMLILTTNTVNQLAILAREYLDDNKNRDDVESMVKGMLQASTAIVSLSRQLKRFEKTVDSHFCCFWNECKGSCQFKNKNAWRTEVADVYTSFESSLSKPSVIKSSSSRYNYYFARILISLTKFVL